MNLIQQLQEKYLAEFAGNTPLGEFLLNIAATAVLALVLRWFYIRYGQALSNRQRMANNFLPLALGTLLVITIVKSSIALSLGLVGALSIVRFRAAIKDPEELTFLFLAIGIGLAGGANQPILASIAFTAILSLLFLHRRLTAKRPVAASDGLFVHIRTEVNELRPVTDILTRVFPHVELRRLDTSGAGLSLTFLCRVDNLDQVEQLRAELAALPGQTTLSIVEQPQV